MVEWTPDYKKNIVYKAYFIKNEGEVYDLVHYPLAKL